MITVRYGSIPIDYITVVDGAVVGTLSFDRVEAGCDEPWGFEAAWWAVGPGDALTLIYTSGSTDPPRGVKLTHHHIMKIRGIMPGGRTTSFLPAAHIVVAQNPNVPSRSPAATSTQTTAGT